MTANQLEMLHCIRFLYYQKKNSHSSDILCEYCVGTVEDPHNYMRTGDHTSMRLIDCTEHPVASKRCKLCKIEVYEEKMMYGCNVCIAVREAMYALADVRGDEDLNFTASTSDYNETDDEEEVEEPNYDAGGETTDFEEEGENKKADEVLESPQSPPIMIETGQLFTVEDSGSREEIATEVHFSQY